MVAKKKNEQSKEANQCRASHGFSSRRRDTVLRLARRGCLRVEELTAALELERCILSNNSGLVARRYEQRFSTSNRPRIGPGGERGLVALLEQRRALKRWVDRLKAESGGHDAMRVTLDVIMGEGLAQIDQRYRRRRGWARLRLNEGLRVFCLIQKKT